MSSQNHDYLIRTITADGQLVAEESDFIADAVWDWFEEITINASSGEIVQLIENDNILAEQTVE